MATLINRENDGVNEITTWKYRGVPYKITLSAADAEKIREYRRGRPSNELKALQKKVGELHENEQRKIDRKIEDVESQVLERICTLIDEGRI